ncbi:GspH/FimT family pseudopilin [Sphaerotilus montanus]|uniref:GspH/FimT family pseudopilin n=1 Tax=Sphaerotilus montanus TaxID=522889 RepID=UPI003FA24E91
MAPPILPAPYVSADSVRGFTLVEMMVTVAVLAILASVAMPALTAFTARNRLSALSSDVVSSLALARTEAARTGLPVLVWPATGGVTGNEYGKGWSLYLDKNGNGTVDSDETPLRTYAALPGTLKMQSASTLNFSAIGYLTPASNVTFVLCPATGLKDGVRITVPPSGLPYVKRIITCS